MAKNRGVLTRAAAMARLSLDQRPVAHFLHIGKTAGTAVIVALKQSQDTAKYRLVRQPHQFGLLGVPETDHYFFCVRDPIDRYISAFRHRELQGRPRYLIPWSEAEAKAFARFPSPDALAVSLSAGGPEQRDAEAAMRAIQHVRSSYWDWFRDPDYFKSRADHILWIGRQESLDLKPLAAALGLERLELPTDPPQANKSPGPKPDLSDLARQNLREWYGRDYLFLELCDELDPGARRAGFGRPRYWSNLRGSSDERAAVCSSQCGRPPIGAVARARKHLYRRWLLAHTAFLRHR